MFGFGKTKAKRGAATAVRRSGRAHRLHLLIGRHAVLREATSHAKGCEELRVVRPLRRSSFCRITCASGASRVTGHMAHGAYLDMGDGRPRPGPQKARVRHGVRVRVHFEGRCGGRTLSKKPKAVLHYLTL